MTDKQKIKHAIEVLKSLEVRKFCNVDKGGITVPGLVTGLYGNMLSLRHLLEKPHETEKKDQGREGPVWAASVALAGRLRNAIRKRKPNFREVSIVDWAAAMCRIIRIDKRTPEQIAEVINWCQQDSFWQDNILSPAKLRKQLDQLELKMSKDFHWQKNKLKRRQVDGPTAREKYLRSLKDETVTGDDERSD